MPQSTTERLMINRRRVMALAGVAAGAPAVAAAPGTLPMTSRSDAPQSLRRPGPDTISVAAIQLRVLPIEPGQARAAIATNVSAATEAIDRVQSESGHKDLITFSALALQGWVTGDGRDLAAAAIDLDGPEVAAIAAKAKKYGSHISFGGWVTDRDWPDRVIAMTILVGPEGGIIARDWAPVAAAQSLPDAGRYAATIESEFDRYIDMYGEAAVLPVHGTALGVIAQSSINNAPEIHRAYALKGAEILLRTAPLGFQTWDAQASAAYNHMFSVVTMAAAPADGDPTRTPSVPKTGGTVILGPHGDVLAEAGSKWEQAVVAKLPMAAFRALHHRPALASRLFLPTYQTESSATA